MIDYELRVFRIEIALPETLPADFAVSLSLIFIPAFLLVAALAYRRFFPQSASLAEKLFSTELGEIYQQVIKPQQFWVSWTILFVSVGLVILTLSALSWLIFLEFPLGLLLAVNVSWLGFRLFTRLFDSYLLEVALKDDHKINSELLALAKFLAKAVIVPSVVFLFAQIHQTNRVGLIASWLLDIARENSVERLQNKGIVVKFEESIVDVTQPMSI